MKKLSILFVSCLLSLDIQAQADLVPAPQQAQWGNGNYTLPQQPTIACSSAGIMPAAEYLQTCLKNYVSINASVARGKQGDIRLSVKKGLAKDGYDLKVTENGIDIIGADFGGILSGIATLNQLLLIKGSVPFVTISDTPRFGWRGFH